MEALASGTQTQAIIKHLKDFLPDGESSPTEHIAHICNVPFGVLQHDVYICIYILTHIGQT